MWSTVSSIGTLLLLILQVNLFAGIVDVAVNHDFFRFIPTKHVYLSYQNCDSDFSNKATSKKSYFLKVKIFLFDRILLHQKGAISHEVDCGQQTCLEERVPSDKNFNHDPTSCYYSNLTTNIHIVNNKSFTNTTIPSHLEIFDSDYVQLHIDNCVSSGFAGLHPI